MCLIACQRIDRSSGLTLTRSPHPLAPPPGLGLTIGDIDAIERATIAAVAPQALETLDGWLLPMDGGTIGRAKSAVPLDAADTSIATLQRIAGRYQAQGLRAAFRIADLPRWATLRSHLAELGYEAARPTWVQVATTAAMAALAPAVNVALEPRPDAAWEALFLGPGFDPVDGASRVRSLSRATGSLYASVREDGATLAAGALAFGHGWLSIHGMRTDAAHRGRGLAGRILAAAGEAALARGINRCFLQVEEANAAAQALYHRAGFQTVWSYAYWAPRLSSDQRGLTSNA